MYPEHEKLAAVADESQAIGEFLDSCPYVLCRVVPEGNNGEPRYIDIVTGETREKGGFDAEWNPAYESWREHYAPIGSIQDVLAEHFGIDRDALEREKREMLNAIRSRV